MCLRAMRRIPFHFPKECWPTRSSATFCRSSAVGNFCRLLMFVNLTHVFSPGRLNDCLPRFFDQASGLIYSYSTESALRKTQSITPVVHFLGEAIPRSIVSGRGRDHDRLKNRRS